MERKTKKRKFKNKASNINSVNLIRFLFHFISIILSSHLFKFVIKTLNCKNFLKDIISFDIQIKTT